MNLTNVSCCGIRELAGLSAYSARPSDALKRFVLIATNPYVPYGTNPATILKQLKDFKPRFRYVVFSQAGARSKYGFNFAKYIEEHKLGAVVRSDSKFHRNPNSGNYLTAWIWTMDEKAIGEHVKELVKKEGSKADPTEQLNRG